MVPAANRIHNSHFLVLFEHPCQRLSIRFERLPVPDDYSELSLRFARPGRQEIHYLRLRFHSLLFYRGQPSYLQRDLVA